MIPGDLIKCTIPRLDKTASMVRYDREGIINRKKQFDIGDKDFISTFLQKDKTLRLLSSNIRDYVPGTRWCFPQLFIFFLNSPLLIILQLSNVHECKCQKNILRKGLEDTKRCVMGVRSKSKILFYSESVFFCYLQYPWKYIQYPISLEVKWQISHIPKTPIQASRIAMMLLTQQPGWRVNKKSSGEKLSASPALLKLKLSRKKTKSFPQSNSSLRK